MSTHTTATEFLTHAGIPFTTVHYHYAPEKGHIGEQAAHAINASSNSVFKTLVAKIDRKQPVFAVIPVSQRANFKAIATALGGRNAKMMQTDEAHNCTGYVSGGTTPLGARHALPVILNQSALSHDKIWINAGAQGCLICLTPHDLQHVTQATLAHISL